MSKVVLTEEQYKGLVERIADELVPHYVNDGNDGRVQVAILATVGAISKYLEWDNIDLADLALAINKKDFELTRGRKS